MCGRGYDVFVAIMLSLVMVSVVNGQGCSSTCPPVNFGQVVPALCEGDVVDLPSKRYEICDPSNAGSFTMNDLAGPGRVTVFANYYTGCNAGRRESGVFAHVSQRFYNQYGKRTTFIQSLKGGGTCQQWADLFQTDALQLYGDDSSVSVSVIPKEMPWTVDDGNYELRDDLFTTPFGHPSYVILDGNLQIRHKFIGPCCGYEDYYDCTADIAKLLDVQLTAAIETILQETVEEEVILPDGEDPLVDTSSDQEITLVDCEIGDWANWSECSVTFGSGVQFRHRVVTPGACYALAPPIETQSCEANVGTEDVDEDTCIQEFGQNYEIETIASGFDSPRDVAFHPTPGYHLGEYSEGRPFSPNVGGEEAWVVNGNNHSVSIIASLGTDQQTTMSRRDRGYYHYMINGTALAFNMVSNSNRTTDRDGYNYWAICNDNLNTYIDTKEANYFMGPTLYNSSPKKRNVVNRLGDECQPEDSPCYFLHSDMLHESPGCIGIAHDPETITAYGNVYWAFDSTGNRNSGQLVRFDFQQPHGPGSMDHSIAAIRRYVEVELERGPPGVHAGMVVHPTLRQLILSVPGSNKILVVGADSGQFARTAREEYPIFSNRLPSFEYSIWECAEFAEFATNLDMPTGLALSLDGETLFVGERGSGNILVYEIRTGAPLYSIPTPFRSIGGLAVSPKTGMLYFVDQDTNTLNRIQPLEDCTNPVPSRVNPSFEEAFQQVVEDIFGIDQETAGQSVSPFSLMMHDFTCQVDPVIPNATFFDQVHVNTGYADENPNVQSVMAGMDEAAALLANRTDCEWDSELNFDALLLGGYFCHQCLPEQKLACDMGGVCTNVQWVGYTCGNEYVIQTGENAQIQTANGTLVDPSEVVLKDQVTYRFTVVGDGTVCAQRTKEVCASKGPLLVAIHNEGQNEISFTIDGKEAFQLAVETVPKSKKLSGGALAGIVIASLVGVALGIFAISKLAAAEKKGDGK